MGSNQALDGKPETPSKAGAPEGSFALTVKFSGLPGWTDCVGGTVSVGPAGWKSMPAGFNASHCW